MSDETKGREPKYVYSYCRTSLKRGDKIWFLATRDGVNALDDIDATELIDRLNSHARLVAELAAARKALEEIEARDRVTPYFANDGIKWIEFQELRETCAIARAAGIGMPK